MSDTFEQDDLELLRAHLQAMVAVELFTIPLYLTGVYSFTNAALESPTLYGGQRLFMMQQEALSVAVQEMYHLQLACNLANAYGVVPSLPQLSMAAGADIAIPHLEDQTTSLGNLPHVIASMVDIETPDVDPDFPPPNAQVTYRSISDLYHAALQLLAAYFAAHGAKPSAAAPGFDPVNQIAYGTFEGTYRYNQVTMLPLVAKAANAVTDQGEGKLVAPNANSAAAAAVSALFAFADDDDILPEFQAAPGTRFGLSKNVKWPAYSHFKRFSEIQAALATVPADSFYSPGAPHELPPWVATYRIEASTVQDAINTVWSYLIDVMQLGFSTGKLPPGPASAADPAFSDAMLAFKYLIPLSWQFGACPSFAYEPGRTGIDAQAAMDSVDPLCLYHWDTATIAVRARGQLNSCQGLNQCAGQGWGGIATAKGDGACATADFHTCGGGNSCKSQGGCAFFSYDNQGVLLGANDQWIPGLNLQAGWGGCQTPIAAGQVFARGTEDTIDSQASWPATSKAALTALIGTNVWDHARESFAAAEGIAALPQPKTGSAGGVAYDGTARRKAIQATST